MQVEQKTILATTSSFAADSPARLVSLAGYGLQLVLNPWGRKLNEDELAELLQKKRPVGLLAGTEPITRRVLIACRDFLRVISRVGVGWDNVDREVAAELGIRVYRTAGVLAEAVAELTIGFMLAALRCITLQDRQVRQGLWQKRMGALLRGKVVGIIGFGSIGQRVGELVQAFGCEVIYCDPRAAAVPWASRLTLRQILAQADIVTIHAGGKEQILGAAELAGLGRRGLILINTARGEMIDDEALVSCLADGRIGFACLDVFQEEPYRGSFCGVDNVILTPHIGSYAREARELMEETAIEHLVSGLKEIGVL